MYRRPHVLLTLLLATACGSTESNGSSTSSAGGSGGMGGTSGSTSSSSGGSGGSAASATSATGGSSSAPPEDAECGSSVCEGLDLGISDFPNANACCPEGEDEDACGVETTLLRQYDVMLSEDCQPRNSPGELDANCPASPPVSASGISFVFPGCCLPSGTCGFMLDSAAGVIQLGLGCVDGGMFVDDELPSCEPAIGAGGAGG